MKERMHDGWSERRMNGWLNRRPNVASINRLISSKAESYAITVSHHLYPPISFHVSLYVIFCISFLLPLQLIVCILIYPSLCHCISFFISLYHYISSFVSLYLSLYHRILSIYPCITAYHFLLNSISLFL